MPTCTHLEGRPMRAHLDVSGGRRCPLLRLRAICQPEELMEPCFSWWKTYWWGGFTFICGSVEVILSIHQIVTLYQSEDSKPTLATLSATLSATIKQDYGVYDHKIRPLSVILTHNKTVFQTSSVHAHKSRLSINRHTRQAASESILNHSGLKPAIRRSHRHHNKKFPRHYPCQNSGAR